ncbi:hypothetical protein [Acinetobacter sp. ANC 4640]
MDKQLDPKALLFSVSSIEVPVATDGQKRTFKGISYSGGRVTDHCYWGDDGVVFDLEGIQIPSVTPLLGEHDCDSRVGVVTNVTTNKNIEVSGNFLSNEDAQKIVSDADDGFPFQMSMYIKPGSIEEVLQGQTVNVNGQDFAGPIVVFRKNRIREFTICSLGADENTSIEAFSSKSNQKTTQEDTDVTELEKAQAAQAQAEKERDDALEELKQFKAKKRADDIAQLEADLKTQFSAEDKTAYESMDDTMFSFTAKQMRQFSGGKGTQPSGQQQTTPQSNPAFAHLFNHQANGGQGSGELQPNQENKLTTAVNKFAATAK